MSTKASCSRRCPRLRKHRITGWPHKFLKVHAPLLKELDVEVDLINRMIPSVDIAAPMLKKLRFASGPGPRKCPGAKVLTLFYSVPMVEDLLWPCSCGSATNRFGVPWCIFDLTLKTVSRDEDKDFGRQIFKIIPVTNFQVLELRIETKGHKHRIAIVVTEDEQSLSWFKRLNNDEQPPNCCNQFWLNH
ncbi:hypothetical protein EJB05_12633, partial [Eragrostis curvula]